MRSKGMEKLLRVLLVLLGIGVGLAAAQLGPWPPIRAWACWAA